MDRAERRFSSVEICAGAGGQAIGLHEAQFRHKALIEIDDHAVATLRANVADSAEWAGCEVISADLHGFNPDSLGLRRGDLDLLSGGVPCAPFSTAGRQLGEFDERDLFPVTARLVDALLPKAVMIENVRGLLEPEHKFRAYRERYVVDPLTELGYEICEWKVIEARDYGVPQLRPRAVLVAMRKPFASFFEWPKPSTAERVTVGKALAKSMHGRFGSSPRGRAAFEQWYEKAKREIAPTLVGGSKKHGGADLGPSRAKKAWLNLGVDATGVANEPDEMKDPERDLYCTGKSGEPLGPKLTVSQAAIIQGFPEHWRFVGRKTATYRQVGNAFPPPVARAIGEQIARALELGSKEAPQAADRAPANDEHDALFPLPASSLPAARPERADRGGNLQGTRVG